MDTTKYSLNKLNYVCTKIAPAKLEWFYLKFKGQSYDDLVQYKGQTILPDININGNAVADPGCFYKKVI